MQINQKFKNIKIVNLITIFSDIAAIIVYFVIFLLAFLAIKAPAKSGDLENPDLTTQVVLEILGKTYSLDTINVIVSLSAVFMFIGIALLINNLKHMKGLKSREFHRWEAGNMLIQAILSLLTINVVSCLLRIFNANQVSLHSEGITLIGLSKKIKDEIIVKRKNRKEKNLEEFTPEEIVMKKRIRRQTTAKISKYSITYIILIFFAVVVLIPFYWMILTSLKTFQESKATNPALSIPFSDLQWINIKFVIENLSFGKYMGNTMLVAVLSTLGTVITTVLAAFAFARLEFKGREALFSVLLMTMMIPGEIYMITNFLTVSRSGFGWIGNGEIAMGYFATMILPFMVSVFYIFLLRQTFRQIPDSLYKAAKVDGCSDFKFLRRIMIPIAAPTILTITILSLLGSWNAFIWPRLITSVDPASGQNYWLVSVALRESNFVLDKGGGVAEVMYNLQIAASAIVTVPLLIVFMLFRKRIMSGVGRSGTKG